MMYSPNRMYVETYKTKPYIALDGVGQGVCSRTGFSNSVIFLIDNAIKPKIFKSSVSIYVMVNVDNWSFYRITGHSIE